MSTESSAVREQSDAAFCADLVRTSDFERYAASLFMEPESRRALLSLYAFNNEIARVREQISQPLAGEIRLQWWHDLLDGIAQGEAAGNPVAAELLHAVERYHLPRETLTRMIDAHRFDLYDEPMATMSDIEGYLRDTASALLALGAQVLGEGAAIDKVVPHHAGLAIGLVRIIEALPRHAARGQIYLPADRLTHVQVDPTTIVSGQSTPELLTLLRTLAAEARAHRDAAMAGLADVPKPARRAFLPLALVGRALDLIGGKTYNPFAPSQMSRLRVLTSMWLKARAFDRL